MSCHIMHPRHLHLWTVCRIDPNLPESYDRFAHHHMQDLHRMGGRGFYVVFRMRPSRRLANEKIASIPMLTQYWKNRGYQHMKKSIGPAASSICHAPSPAWVAVADTTRYHPMGGETGPSRSTNSHQLEKSHHQECYRSIRRHQVRTMSSSCSEPARGGRYKTAS